MKKEQAPDPGGWVFDTDHFSVHDGPGIRTVVYLKGCPLCCLWCHSPESQSPDPEPLRLADKCRKCSVCAAEHCPYGAWLLCGRRMSVQDILQEVLPDKIFYETSGGGVTLSGGEVLMQPAFAKALLQGLVQEGIHTVVETSGFGRWEDLAALSPLVDGFYFDIKTVSAEKHKQFTGAGNQGILDNLARLARQRQGRGIVLRAPLIPGYNDADGDVQALFALAEQYCLDQVHLLPYNVSAPAKYDWVGRAYAPGELKRQDPDRLRALCAMAPPGLCVTVQ